eukprot:TRINITY_DN23304_c0_g1_i1.p1 TRINITY_DN23304_c0_g1~~TRINITY_DN23304_c0_g1_i1.p1  ORF type:complete len:691 (-),score=144.94 TRINITY_DN23304_c0_g1_i1:1150-3222(-)
MAAAPGAPGGAGSPWLRVRREPFEFGVLPFPSIVHSENLTFLQTVRTQLEALAAPSPSADSLCSAAVPSGIRSAGGNRVGSAALAGSLGLSESHSQLLLDTLASVLPDDAGEVDPLAIASVQEVPSIGADIDHVILFLYLQMYRRAAHRTPISPALADVWPAAPSPFDAYTALSPSVKASSPGGTNRPRGVGQAVSMTQGEDEGQQLAFVQKHLGNLLILLAEPLPEGADESTRVITAERLEALSLLLRAASSPLASLRRADILRQVTPFFANSDSAMPAAPVAVPLVQEWLAKHICGASDHVRSGAPPPPSTPSSSSSANASAGANNGAASGSETGGAAAASGAAVAAVEGGCGEGASTDVTMTEAGSQSSTSAAGAADVSMGEAAGVAGVAAVAAGGSGGAPAQVQVPGVLTNGFTAGTKDFWPAGMTVIEGVTKMSVLKGENDIENGVVRISHCHDAVVYVLAPLRYASIVGCSDSIIILGPTGRAVKGENCERVQVIAACARMRISTCRDCIFHLGTNQSPLAIGDNHNLQVAPYNTFYPKLESQLSQAGVDPTLNRWDKPITLSVADPLSMMANSAGAADAQAEGPALLPPEKFVPFVVPFRAITDAQQQQTRGNPFPLPKTYLTALQVKTKTVESLRQTLKTAVLEEGKKKELTNVIQAHFKDWLIASGNIRQVYDLSRFDRDP